MSKFMACVFAAFALAGCCVSGTGCYAPVTGSQAQLDGLNEPPHDETPKQTLPRKEETLIAQPKGDTQAVSKTQAKEEWEQQEPANRAFEARLTKKLKICNGCSGTPEKADRASEQADQ
jgi:hypothetical protein